MFGRSPSTAPAKPAEPTKVGTPPAPSQSATPGYMPSPQAVPMQAGATQQGSLAVSLIGRDLTISGEKINIISHGRLQVDGEVLGDLTGREIVVGETGRVSGSIAAESIDVRGKVDGGIRGSSVSLRQSARVTGDIVHQTLSIAEGAHFDGRVRRAKDGEEIKPDLSSARKL